MSTSFRSAFSISTRFRLAGVLVVCLVSSAGALTGQSNSLVASSGPSATTASIKPAVVTTKPVAMVQVKDFSTDVRDGILTVDGMVGKAGLNYNIHQGFMYFTIPGVGTAIVAQNRFPNALPQKNAFHGNTLTFAANGHTVELTSANPLVSGKQEAWVNIDPLYGANIRFPQMGFGQSLSRPYVWPGSKTFKEKANANALVTPPPLPPSVRPKPEIASSYTVVVPGTDAQAKNK